MLQDLKHGIRMLLKNPGFTCIAVVSIAIGVGANAAMFSLADGLVLRPLAVPRSNEIIAVSARAPRVGGAFITTSLLSRPDYLTCAIARAASMACWRTARWSPASPSARTNRRSERWGSP